MEEQDDPLVTKNVFKGFLKKKLTEDAKRLGVQPGRVLKMIAHKYYRRKAA